MAIKPHPGLLHDLKNMDQTGINLEEFTQLNRDRPERFPVGASVEIEQTPAREVRLGQGTDGGGQTVYSRLGLLHKPRSTGRAWGAQPAARSIPRVDAGHRYTPRVPDHTQKPRLERGRFSQNPPLVFSRLSMPRDPPLCVEAVAGLRPGQLLKLAPSRGVCWASLVWAYRRFSLLRWLRRHPCSRHLVTRLANGE